MEHLRTPLILSNTRGHHEHRFSRRLSPLENLSTIPHCLIFSLVEPPLSSNYAREDLAFTPKVSELMCGGKARYHPYLIHEQYYPYMYSLLSLALVWLTANITSSISYYSNAIPIATGDSALNIKFILFVGTVHNIL